MPVPFSLYVFPGGNSTFNTTVGPGGVLDSATAPQGGAKELPYTPAAGDVILNAQLNKLNLSFEDPQYFQYAYVPLGVNTGATVTITACADMNVGAANAHTITQALSVDVNSQEVEVGPSTTTNEFL